MLGVYPSYPASRAGIAFPPSPPSVSLSHDPVHGADAARRQAVSELLFFASVGDLRRCMKITAAFELDLNYCADYDKRTPLHVAACNGAFSVVEWLLENTKDPSPIDKFQRTPLFEALNSGGNPGGYREIAALLQSKGGKIVDTKTGELVDTGRELSKDLEVDPAWEIDPRTLKLLTRVGAGEFGEVYLGKWNGALVAVKKLLRSDEVAMGDFRTELHVLSGTHHPHTVQFLGAVTKSLPLMLVTEFCPGGSLADVLKERVPMTTGRQCEIALDTARGLLYLHSQNPTSVIHRDLKPANLLVGGNPYMTYRDTFVNRLKQYTGMIKISDFGLSKTLVSMDNEFDDLAYASTGQAEAIRKGNPSSFKPIAEEELEGQSFRARLSSIERAERQPAAPGRGADLDRTGSRTGHSSGEMAAGIDKSIKDRDKSRPGTSRKTTVAKLGNLGVTANVYEMTGETGSYRYMAPEVFRHEPYNTKVDVYSYAMILYYLFEGVPPFFDKEAIDVRDIRTLSLSLSLLSSFLLIDVSSMTDVAGRQSGKHGEQATQLCRS
jgi:serine/threonine protein kinase